MNDMIYLKKNHFNLIREIREKFWLIEINWFKRETKDNDLLYLETISVLSPLCNAILCENSLLSHRKHNDIGRSAKRVEKAEEIHALKRKYSILVVLSNENKNTYGKIYILVFALTLIGITFLIVVYLLFLADKIKND